MLIIVLLLGACGQSEPTSTDKKGSSLPADFVSFYDQFHSDSVYQLNHIQFPLENHSDSSDVPWTRENWELHQPYQNDSDLFRRSYSTTGSTLVTETITSPKLEIEIERRWRKSGDRWMLIYYRPLQ